MKVQELIDILANLTPDADVKVLYNHKEWTYDHDEKCSVEVEGCAWGAVEGVIENTANTEVKIYAQLEDVEAC